MIYQGRNLIISVDGVVIGGSKSCSLDVDVNTTDVSSPTDADWVHIKARMKKWSVSTDHLLKSDMAVAHTIKAVGISHNGSEPGTEAYCIVDGNKYGNNTRGFQLRTFEWDSEAGRLVTKVNYSYDTYDSSEAIADMIDDLTNDIDTGDIVVITSYDACAITTELAAAIETALGLPTGSVPVFEAARASFVAIGKYQDKGISFCNMDSGNTVHATLYLNSVLEVITSSPIRSGAMMVGQSCKIRLNVEGFADDVLTGEAIITSFKAQGTLGNLAQGKFSFKGNGPLT